MNVVSTREKLNEAIQCLDLVRAKIIGTNKFGEEMVRVNEMSAAILAFSSLDDSEIQKNIYEIGRVSNAVCNYSDFMISSF